jgi:hypothetical protein
MELQQQLLVSIVDKGLLALVLTIVAGLVKWILQRDAAQRDLMKAIAPQRATAYASLWNATEDLRRTNPPALTEERRKSVQRKLDEAYFGEGAAMYLSHKAASLFLRAKARLNDNAPESELREMFSAFRTQLKEDLLIYSKRDARTPLHRA